MDNVVFSDNSDEMLEDYEARKHLGLEAIGLSAEAHAKERLTATVYTGNKPWVVSGRLRNSVTYAIAGYPAHVKSYAPDNKTVDPTVGTYEGAADGKKDEAVYIGTNVRYAEGIELGTHRAEGAVHFLQHAAQDFGEEYKLLMEEALAD